MCWALRGVCCCWSVACRAVALAKVGLPRRSFSEGGPVVICQSPSIPQFVPHHSTRYPLTLSLSPNEGEGTQRGDLNPAFPLAGNFRFAQTSIQYPASVHRLPSPHHSIIPLFHHSCPKSLNPSIRPSPFHQIPPHPIPLPQ